MKFPSALARNSAFAGAGETRYASSTWLRNSRAQVWLSATTAANRNATHTKPPTICRDSSASGSKENTKITTTSKEKNNMEFSASFERHSSRISFTRVTSVTAQSEFIECPRQNSLPGPGSEFDRQSAPPASTRIHRRRLRAAAPGG